MDIHEDLNIIRGDLNIYNDSVNNYSSLSHIGAEILNQTDFSSTDKWDVSHGFSINSDGYIEFDYQTSKILNETSQTTKYYDIEIKYGNVLCLDLNDEKNRIRKIITTFFDGTTQQDVLDSKDNIYYSPRGAVKVSVGKPKFIIAGRRY